MKPYDFNGDGFPELVVGAPGLTVGSHQGAGGAFVFPASKAGVASRAETITAASPGVVGTPRDGEGFGSAFASGDFDGDGFADLAVARPSAPGGGAVTVLYGSVDGLTGARSRELPRPWGASTIDAFAVSLAAGDFDGDGRADLAVGDPWDDFPGHGSGSGAVAVFRGGAAGLAPGRSSLLYGSHGAPGYQYGDDLDFGSTLAVGDLDQDGRTDLVVGSYGVDAGSGDGGYPGAVDACYGAPGGLTGCTQLASDGSLAESRSIAVGNVVGSARPEIVVGVAPEGGQLGGDVVVLSLSGPRASTTVDFSGLTEGSSGVPGAMELGDDFGEDVALGDLDGDRYDDLVIGVPGENEDAGRVVVVYGGGPGLRPTGGLSYSQSTKGVPGKAEKHDRFGASVALLDHDGDGHLDLTVGAPGENRGTGAITTLDGSGRRFTTKGARTSGLGSRAYPTPGGAGFGTSLGTGSETAP